MRIQAPTFSDQALADEVAGRFGENWRYVSDMDVWVHWNGTYWQPDTRGAVTVPIKIVCCENAKRAADAREDKGVVRGLASTARNSAVLKRLSTDQRLVVTHDQLDADPMLLGTPAGCVDLLTGDLLPPDRKYLITMVTA